MMVQFPSSISRPSSESDGDGSVHGAEMQQNILSFKQGDVRRSQNRPPTLANCGDESIERFHLASELVGFSIVGPGAAWQSELA
jgi:hypothetical protein